MAKRRLLFLGSNPSRAIMRSSNVKHYNNVPLPLMVARETAEQVLFVILFHLTSIQLPCTLIHCMTSRVQTTQFKLTLKYLHLQDCKTTTEKPRDYIHMPPRNLALGAARSRALCGSIVYSSRSHTDEDDLHALGSRLRNLLIPSILYIFAIAQIHVT